MRRLGLLALVLFLALVLVVLLYRAIHHHLVVMVLAFVLALVLAVLLYRAILGRRAQVRRRVRALRWRARLRLRPGARVCVPGRARVPLGPPGRAFAWPPGPAGPSVVAAAGHTRDGLCHQARPRAVLPPGVCADGGSGPYTGTPAHGQVRSCSLTGYSAIRARSWPPAPAPICTSSPRPPGRAGAARSTSLTRRASAACRPLSRGTSWSPAAIL